jgi:hypothetical protein
MKKDDLSIAEAYELVLEAKKKSNERKGKDMHVIAALKAEIKTCKSAEEKKKLQAKLAKYEADLAKA